MSQYRGEGIDIIERQLRGEFPYEMPFEKRRQQHRTAYDLTNKVLDVIVAAENALGANEMGRVPNFRETAEASQGFRQAFGFAARTGTYGTVWLEGLAVAHEMPQSNPILLSLALIGAAAGVAVEGVRSGRLSGRARDAINRNNPDRSRNPEKGITRAKLTGGITGGGATLTLSSLAAKVFAGKYVNVETKPNGILNSATLETLGHWGPPVGVVLGVGGGTVGAINHFFSKGEFEEAVYGSPQIMNAVHKMLRVEESWKNATGLDDAQADQVLLGLLTTAVTDQGNDHLIALRDFADTHVPEL